ncbi:hypothetical protein B0H10DRAFT_2184421 [Mycena sp. CBHHK59/15]|nr:hypothetical protein B0H10DRAFT_2184421 [Mycena sp. CBHHK59/15]
MLNANGFEAWITIDGGDVQHFQPEIVGDPAGVTCWIASEVNKGFAIHWRNTDVFCQTGGRVWVDGNECPGEIIQGPNLEAVVSGRRTSGSTMAPFVFSPLDLTDDDAFLDSTAHQNIGLVRLEVWRINQTGTKPYPGAAPVADSKIHERSKKGVAHQIKFGEAVEGVPRLAAVFDYMDRVPVVTFSFKYRSLDILRANGIAPCKRKAVTSPEPGPSGVAKQEAKSGPKVKRVKKEGGAAGSFTPGEIIDLTRSVSPAFPEVIDLT